MLWKRLDGLGVWLECVCSGPSCGFSLPASFLFFLFFKFREKNRFKCWKMQYEFEMEWGKSGLVDGYVEETG